jgi:hypothetical protein
VVDCTCLENKSPFTRTVSSNLTSSAKKQKRLSWRFCFLIYTLKLFYLFTNALVLGPKYPVPFLSPLGVRISVM